MIRQLRATRSAIAGWDQSLRTAADFSQEARQVLALVEDAQHALARLLAQLGDTGGEVSSASPFPARADATADSERPLPQICVDAARACGRALGTAFREAQAAADAASAGMLYRSLRAFEKQIWMLDPRQAAG